MNDQLLPDACGISAIVLKDAVELPCLLGLIAGSKQIYLCNTSDRLLFGRHLKHMHTINYSKFFYKLSSFRSYFIFECINEHNESSHHKNIMEAVSVKLINKHIRRWGGFWLTSSSTTWMKS